MHLVPVSALMPSLPAFLCSQSPGLSNTQDISLPSNAVIVFIWQTDACAAYPSSLHDVKTTNPLQLFFRNSSARRTVTIFSRLLIKNFRLVL